MALGLTTAKRVFFIVVLVSIVASLVMIGEFYRTGAFTAYNPVQSQITKSIGLYLYFGNYIATQVTAVGEGQALCFSTGTIQTNAGRTAYRQSLQFGIPGAFNGGMLVFKEVRTPTETASTALTFPLGQPLFQYQINFDSGLNSRIENNVLRDLDDRSLNLLGTTFTFMSSQNRYNQGSNLLQLRLIGGFGTIDITDTIDAQFREGGVRVNGQVVDADVRVLGGMRTGDVFGIDSIEYRPKAEAIAPSADFDVLPRHGVSEYMKYPQALLTPEFNLFFVGMGSGYQVPTPNPKTTSTPGAIRLKGTRKQYRLDFATKTGGYNMDLIALDPGLKWGSKSGNRDFIFKENLWIDVQDYFAISSGTGLNDRSWIMSLNKIQTSNNKVFWRDLAKGQTKEAKYDPVTGQGSMNVGGYDFAFQVNPGGTAIKVDLNNDGAIAASTVQIVLSNSLRMKFSGAGTIEIIVPWQLREESAVDEVNKIQVSKSGSSLTAQVTSPTMQDDPSVEGREQGMSQYGVRFVWDGRDTPEEINVYPPGSGGQAYASVGIGTYTGQSRGILLLTCEQSALQAAQQAK